MFFQTVGENPTTDSPNKRSVMKITDAILLLNAIHRDCGDIELVHVDGESGHHDPVLEFQVQRNEFGLKLFVVVVVS